MDKKILCIGDSITWGAWDSRGGWVTRVREKIDAESVESDLKKFILTYNLGVSSDTSADVLARLPGEIQSRMKEGGEACFIFSIGTNDSIVDVKSQKHWVEIEDFKRNIQEIVDIAKRHSDRIAFLGSMPVDELKTQPHYSSDSDISSSNDDIEMYDKAVQEVAQTNNVKFIEVFSLFNKESAKEALFSDGVHPNDKGHAKLEELVYEFIGREGWI